MSYTLANRYRPKSFSELKGQDILVKTLTQAVINKKPFNAYLLTGIRGVGKTTAARIMAKTLNCANLQVSDGSASPCGICKSCVECESSSHPDIIEIDAASKTGVNDIRELIESAQYVPLLGVYKVYIIDEVHMLSNSAFNALLKTLEEPPANVIFIFATTEFHKIPKTVVSRCQKFDLRMFTFKEITDHLHSIAKSEGIEHDADSLAQIAKYSGGSMRDSLSLLETIATYTQSISKSLEGSQAVKSKECTQPYMTETESRRLTNQEFERGRVYKGVQQPVTRELVKCVLGLADVDCKYQLFSALLTGKVQRAIEIINEVYYSGYDLFYVLEDLLSICNAASKLIAIKDYLQVMDMPDTDKIYLQDIASKTDVVNLTTIWQMLFKGIQDLKLATNILEAAEILLIKLAYLSNLPSPEEVIGIIMSKNVQENTASLEHADNPGEVSDKTPATFNDAVELFRKNGELILYYQLRNDVQVITYTQSKMELAIRDNLPTDFAQVVAKKLEQWTQSKWTVANRAMRVLNSSLKIQEEKCLKDSSGVIKEVLESFPGARIESVVNIG